MTYEERNNLVAIFTNLMVCGYFIQQITSKFAAGVFDGPDGVAVWAQTVLWVIPASIVATIVVTIVFNILFAIAARDPNPEMVSDERDKMFGNRAMLTVTMVASAGFIMALVMLAFFNWSAFLALNLTLAGFALADLLGNIVKFVSYRRGY